MMYPLNHEVISFTLHYIYKLNLVTKAITALQMKIS